MVSGPDHGDLLRDRDGGEQQVSPFELLFDLVYVFAVTQLSHRLLGELTIGNALETLFLLLAVWWVWVYTTWVTNWFDPRPAAGAPDAGRSDARQPGDVGRDPGGFQRTRADVRRRLCHDTGGTHPVRGPGAG